MTTIYVVVYSIGGYAREDADRPAAAGAYTDNIMARKHASAIGGVVYPVEVDVMPPGIIARIKELGIL